MRKRNLNIDWSRTENITKEDVKAQKAFEHLTDDQANEVVDFVITYSELLYRLYESGKLSESESKISTKMPKK